jgi:hypothetical protein
MKKFTSTLFLALFLAITAISISGQEGGQIPIMGRTTAVAEPVKTPASVINTAVEPKTGFSSGISDYLWTFVSIIRQVKF